MMNSHEHAGDRDGKRAKAEHGSQTKHARCPKSTNSRITNTVVKCKWRIKLRLCKLESVFVITFSVTFQPQSHFWCSGVQSFLLWSSLRTEESCAFPNLYSSFRGLILQPPRNPCDKSNHYKCLNLPGLWLWRTRRIVPAQSGLQSAKSFLRLQLAQ